MRGLKRLSKEGKAIRVLKSVQRNTYDIGISEIYYLLLSELFPPFISLLRRICWCQTSEATSKKDWKWALTTKTNEMGGGGGGGVRREGRGNYFSVSSAKLLLNLLMEFSSFPPLAARVVRQLTEGSWFL